MTVATQQRSRPAAPPYRPRRWLSRLVWAVVIVVLIVLLLPYLLVPLYRFVNPVSTLMLWRWAIGARVERTFVPIDRMAPALPVMKEDAAAETAGTAKRTGWDSISPVGITS